MGLNAYGFPRQLANPSMEHTLADHVSMIMFEISKISVFR